MDQDEDAARAPSEAYDIKAALNGTAAFDAVIDRRLYDEARQHGAQMAILYDIGVALTSALDLDQVLHTLLEQCRRVLPIDIFHVALYDEATDLLYHRLIFEHGEFRTRAAKHLSAQPGMSGAVIRGCKTIYLPDSLDPVATQHYDIVHAGGTPSRSYVGVPLIVRERVIGILSMQSYRPQAYSPEHIRLLETISTQAAVAVENARLYAQAQAQLQERDQLIAELNAFTHTVAHDLKSPLSVITGYADLLVELATFLPPAELSEHAQVIQAHAHHVARIIDSLLLLAGARDTQVPGQPLDMAQIVAAAQQRLVREIAERRAQIAVPPRWPIACGYGPWVEEVWANYMSNALKYGGRPDASPPAPPCLELGATVQADGFVRFWLRDNGPGIPPDDQKRLFIPFSRLGQGRAGGHGLGLSIVERIVRRLGGTVSAESEPSQGSIFSFTLPGLP